MLKIKGWLRAAALCVAFCLLLTGCSVRGLEHLRVGIGHHQHREDFRHFRPGHRPLNSSCRSRRASIFSPVLACWGLPLRLGW